MPDSFTLTHDSMIRIFRAWSIPAPLSGLVLFGFRGGLPKDACAGWVRNIALEPAKVDYAHMRCTLGIWNPASKRIFAAPASTVPHEDNVAKAAILGGKGTNQIEPGYYQDLTKGEHLQGKPRGHQALRQTAGRFYRRSPNGLPYSEKSPLYFGNPYDNLHCGWNLDGIEPGFSSAGCMVVAGLPRCPRLEAPQSNQGAWRIFHDLIYAAPQKSFPLLLLSGAEARAALLEPSPAPGRESAGRGKSRRPRLVFGSKGDGVKSLQRKLIASGLYRGRADGILGSRTYRAWNASGFIGA